jgi:hypothetical protein
MTAADTALHLRMRCLARSPSRYAAPGRSHVGPTQLLLAVCKECGVEGFRIVVKTSIFSRYRASIRKVSTLVRHALYIA